VIRPPSLQRAYDDFFTLDPAIIPAPTEPAETATSEEVEAYTASRAEYDAKIKAAKETGKWHDVVVPGQVPTKFVLGQVDRNIWRAVLDRAALLPDNPQRIGPGLMVALLFRLAIKSVAGFEPKVERVRDPQWDGWEMAQPEIVDALDSIDPRIVGQIGTGIYQRLRGSIPPL
jgi:hypothetical protein